MKKTIKLSLGAASVLVIASLVFCGVSIISKMNNHQGEPSEPVIASSQIVNLSDRPTYDSRTEFDVDKTIASSVSLSMTSANYKDPAKLQAASDYVAIVFIDSIDGADNYAEVTDNSTMITSFGKMTILESLKGDLQPGDTKTFYRTGGIMDFEQYCKHANQAHCDKLRHLDPERNAISESLLQDVGFEVGKTYLAYLIKDESFRDGEGYTFTGLENGTREVQAATTYTLNSNSSDLKVLNNFTGEWENLGDVVKQDK